MFLFLNFVFQHINFSFMFLQCKYIYSSPFCFYVLQEILLTSVYILRCLVILLFHTCLPVLPASLLGPSNPQGALLKSLLPVWVSPTLLMELSSPEAWGNFLCFIFLVKQTEIIAALWGYAGLHDLMHTRALRPTALPHSPTVGPVPPHTASVLTTTD